MNHKIAVYQGSTHLWYWYVLQANEEFQPTIQPGGTEKTVRKAIRKATEYAVDNKLGIVYTYMERSRVDSPFNK